MPTLRRSPLGLRGLKSKTGQNDKLELLSQPSWVAWIEIVLGVCPAKAVQSQPSWVAWIEISNLHIMARRIAVAALLGCVD